MNIVTWKWKGGTTRNKPVYTAEHVNSLYSMLRRNFKKSFTLTCITDDSCGIRDEVRVLPLWDDFQDWGGCYRRIRIFDKSMRDVIGRDFLSIDLDCVIVSDVTDFLSVGAYGFGIWESLKQRRTPFCGSLFYYRYGSFDFIYDEFSCASIRAAKAKFPIGSDQSYLAYQMHGHGYPIHIWNQGIYNFKVDFGLYRVNNQLPSDAKIVFFNGGGADPSLREVRMRNPWVEQHWRV